MVVGRRCRWGRKETRVDVIGSTWPKHVRSSLKVVIKRLKEHSTMYDVTVGFRDLFPYLL